MNWYKISSHNIRIPDNVYIQINNIAQLAAQKNKEDQNGSEEQLGVIKFIDIYSGENISVNVVLSDKQWSGGYFASYNPVNNFIILLRFGGNIDNWDTVSIQDLKKQFYSSIVHEIIHSIDPKIRKDLSYNINQEYDFKFHEFDALCYEITNSVILELKDIEIIDSDEFVKAKKDIKIFLKNKILYNQSCPDIFGGIYCKIIKKWIQNPVFLKKFKQRIVNALEKEMYL